jgi:hypothetical protein
MSGQGQIDVGRGIGHQRLPAPERRANYYQKRN